MSPVTKNILVNAAKSTNQNAEKTIKLTQDLLDEHQQQTIRDAMNSGNPLDWNTIDLIF